MKNSKFKNSGTRHLSPALCPSRTDKPAAPCITRPEFAEMLHVSLRTVDRILADKEIEVHRVRGKVVRILRSDAERYLADGNAGNTSSGLKQPSPGASRRKETATNNSK